MTTPRHLDSDLPAILADLYVTGIPDYRDDLVQRVATTRQRRAWTFPERWLPMADIASPTALTPRVPWRTVAVALLIVGLLVAGLLAYIGSRPATLPAPFGPAANGLIVFERAGDIYLGDPETGQARLLVGGPESDGFAEMSRDGTKVVFGRDVPGGNDLYVVDADGSDLHKITDKTLVGATGGAWSADGGTYYQSHVVDGVGVLDAYDVIGDAAPVRIATNVLDTLAVRPPDGREIAFRTIVDGKIGLSVVRPDGTGARSIVAPTIPASVDMSFNELAYSPDGARIYYQHGDADGCCQLWVMDADGTNDHRFIDSGEAWDGLPRVSPDGTSIAFWHHLNDGASLRVTVARSDGTGPLVETGPVLPDDGNWVWSPDSTKILMRPSSETNQTAWFLDPAGGPGTLVPWESATSTVDWQRTAP